MKMKFFGYLIFILFIISTLSVRGQYLKEDSQKKDRKLFDKIFFGGNFGLSIGSITYIEIAPIVGYRHTERLSSGIGLNYTYYKEEFRYYDNSGSPQTWEYKSKVYGGKVFGEYLLFKNPGETISLNIGKIIAHGEIEELNVETYTHDQYGYMHQDGRKWITSVLVGGGISQPIGSRSSVNLLILYNLTEELFTPYQNPVIRITFNF